ncbi:hypothetical protein PoB_007402600 [Plakobranchus ocellatus]|uniref:Uncharacterized protein n=1 Tax=Plakobranchus ocellatus TaxID=259542 RepID=A0AAV4DUL4_9GAST|nr:hypothetical protein PoB_007402600 [Plakobranchus ocellatus]
MTRYRYVVYKTVITLQSDDCSLCSRFEPGGAKAKGPELTVIRAACDMENLYRMDVQAYCRQCTSSGKCEIGAVSSVHTQCPVSNITSREVKYNLLLSYNHSNVTFPGGV